MKDLFSNISGVAEVRENEPLASHTTFQIGGPCDLMVFPETPEAFAEVLRVCRTNDIDALVLGKGSNMLVSDKGIRGVVIATERLQHLVVDGCSVTASAGLSLINVSKATAELGFTGLEFASGIPGSIGGACYMNAGAYDGEMKDVITSVTVLDENSEIREIPADEMRFSYRHSRLKDEPLICLAVTMQLAHGEKSEILAKIAERASCRQTAAGNGQRRQHVQASAGTFRRTAHHRQRHAGLPRRRRSGFDKTRRISRQHRRRHR